MKRQNGNRTRRRWLTMLPLPLMMIVGIFTGSHFYLWPWKISLTEWLPLLCVSLVMTLMLHWAPGQRHGAIHARRTVRRNLHVYHTRVTDEFK